MQNWIKSTLCAAAISAALIAPAKASLVLDMMPGGSANPCGACGNGQTFGWSFSVRNEIRIDGLGMWDAGSNGLGQPSVQIGLWSGAGSLLASTTVTDASTQVASANLTGEWLFESISALTLGAGDYRIGAVFQSATPLAQVGGVYSTISDITLTGGAQANGTGLADPVNSFSFPIFGPTMRLADANQVPEPSTIALMGLALLGVGVVRSRRSR